MVPPRSPLAFCLLLTHALLFLGCKSGEAPPAKGQEGAGGDQGELAALLEVLGARGEVRFEPGSPWRRLRSTEEGGEALRTEEQLLDALRAVELGLLPPRIENFREGGAEAESERMRQLLTNLTDKSLSKPSTPFAPAGEIQPYLSKLRAQDSASLLRTLAERGAVQRPLAKNTRLAIRREGKDQVIVGENDIMPPPPIVKKPLVVPGTNKVLGTVGRNLLATCLIYRVLSASEAQPLPTPTPTLKDERKLCDSSNFAQERVVAAFVGAGVLVGPQTVATAAHCIPADPAARKRLRFVFGYETPPTSPTITFPKGRVFALAQVKDYQLERRGRRPPTRDWCQVVLDRRPGISPVEVAKSAPSRDERVYMIGHPLGMSLRITHNGRVLRSSSDDAFFSTDLDNLPGNSGGGVFSERTHELIGLFSFGHQDFYWAKEASTSEEEKECRKLYAVDKAPGSGERVMKATQLER